MYTDLLLISLKAAFKISLIIFFLMIISEYLVTRYKDQIIRLMLKNKRTGYILSSLFGTLPGCTGVFAMDSLYMAGYLSFGGIIAALVATMGDETFLLISLAVNGTISMDIIIMLISSMFVLGIVAGFLADIAVKKTGLKLHRTCEIKIHKKYCKSEFNLKHFAKEHIYNHIIRKHMLKIFIWIAIAVFMIEMINSNIQITEFLSTGTSMIYILLAASLIAILPISGPNIIILTMFATGMVPFSVLLANSLIQDGHGLLPILGYSVSDALKIKLFNFIFGLTIGLILLLLGF